MEKKVVFDPQDFAKIADYINSMPVSFARVEQAIEIKAILKRVVVLNIEIIKKEII